MQVTVLDNNVDIGNQFFNLLIVFTMLHRSACCTSQSCFPTPWLVTHLGVCHSGGKLVIINLQKTPKDKKASLVIHARCDEVMQQLMSQMQLPIPSYTRQDTVLVSHAIKKGRVLQDGVQSISCTLRVQSTHGQKCPLPLVQQVDVDFQVHGIASLLCLPGLCKVYIQVHLISAQYGVQSAVCAFVLCLLTSVASRSACFFSHAMLTAGCQNQTCSAAETAFCGGEKHFSSSSHHR